MGMDVYGRNATSEKGEYFRNNVWWWRPLWNYCLEVAPELCGEVDGDTNGGDGLDEDGAQQLSAILTERLATGHTFEYEDSYNKRLAALPQTDCSYCGATGIRTDKVGEEFGMPAKQLEEALAVLLGRTHGTCNGCGGEGKVASWEASYPFSAENVQEFAEFLEQSGGFSIC